jgi:hypothetical protein
MRKASGSPPTMWGTSIVGFGNFHYKYASGHEGDACMVGFSPRKAALTVYLMPGFQPFAEIMGRLGKYKTGKGCCKGCLYIRQLSDVDEAVLEELVREAVQYMRVTYPAGLRS